MTTQRRSANLATALSIPPRARSARDWNDTAIPCLAVAAVAIVGLTLFMLRVVNPAPQPSGIPDQASADAMTSGLVQVDASEQPADWEQFGHSRGWIAAGEIATDDQFVEWWEQEVGEGQSQVVGSEERIYVASGYDQQTADPADAGQVPNKKQPRIITTTFAAYDTGVGRELWKFEAKSEMLPEQQTFGGNRPTPQATPLLIQDRLIGLTFTGDLFCLDTGTGNELWAMNLCEDLHADAVQFGFSASPAKAPNSMDSFVVLAAGPEGGLYKFNALSGEVEWRCPVASFSYATPVFAGFGGTAQWVVMSREHMIGIEDRTGKELWRHTLAEAGLTNVPCPLVVDSRHLVISGQGVGGTRGLEISLDAGKWTINETWFNRRLQFFYTNWTMLRPTIAIGCTEQYMTAFDVRSGEQLGRWRGYGNGNLVRCGNDVLVLGGKGQTSVMHFDSSSNELTVDREYEVTDARCWVAPSTIDGKCFMRCGTKLKCLTFSSAAKASDASLVMNNQIKPGAELHLAMTKAAVTSIDPVEEIFEVFESQGQAAAMKLYQEFRSNKKLSGEHHVALAEAAYKMNLKDLAALVMRDGRIDHPDSKVIKKKMAEWTGAPR
ncbi:MAG: hypothetical protein Aurels2KO_00080 [Aureliella sp.]